LVDININKYIEMHGQQNIKKKIYECCIDRRSDVAQMLSGQGVDLSSLRRRSEGVWWLCSV